MMTYANLDVIYDINLRLNTGYHVLVNEYSTIVLRQNTIILRQNTTHIEPSMMFVHTSIPLA